MMSGLSLELLWIFIKCSCPGNKDRGSFHCPYPASKIPGRNLSKKYFLLCIVFWYGIGIMLALRDFNDKAALMRQERANNDKEIAV
jgi:hypothetical protein